MSYNVRGWLLGPCPRRPRGLLLNSFHETLEDAQQALLTFRRNHDNRRPFAWIAGPDGKAWFQDRAGDWYQTTI